MLADEQADFRTGQWTLDQYIIPNQLVEIYFSQCWDSLFAVLIWFQKRLCWKTLNKYVLLSYINHNAMIIKKEIKWAASGLLSAYIPILQLVTYTWILIPFNRYINSISQALTKSKINLTNKPKSILLYTEDVFILSLIKAGL